MSGLADIIKANHFFTLSDYCGACPCAGGLTLRGVSFESHCWRSNSELGVDVSFNSDDEDCPPFNDIVAAGNVVAGQLAETWDMVFPVRLHDKVEGRRHD